MIHKPLHPGLLVKDVLTDQTGLSVTEAAERLGIIRPRLSRLLNGRASISPEMAFRLSKFFNTSIETWLNLQMQYDVWIVQRHSKEIKVKPYKKVA